MSSTHRTKEGNQRGEHRNRRSGVRKQRDRGVAAGEALGHDAGPDQHCCE
jgi:hypothetical protein